MIDPAEHYLQIYEALDTVAEDVAQLQATKTELLAMCEAPEERVIVAEEAAIDNTHIIERRNYILRSVMGNTATTNADIQVAGLEYVNNYQNPEAQVAASRRVSVYNVLLETVKHYGAIPQHADEAMSYAAGDRPQRPIQHGTVKLHGRFDPETGETWYDPSNPRTVEYMPGSFMHGIGEKVIANYPIKQQTEAETGETIVVAETPGDGTSNIVVNLSEQARTYRVNGSLLELFIPDNTRSLGETTITAVERHLGDSGEAARVAIQATGANIPHIIDSFQDPCDNNPKPISVAKSN